jgi:hypothetical protein
VYRRSSYTSAAGRPRRRVAMIAIEMMRPAAPAIIRITPMTCRSTWVGFQMIANRRIAPMTMSAILPPIVTVIVTSSNFHDAPEIRVTPRPAQVIWLLARMDCAY